MPTIKEHQRITKGGGRMNKTREPKREDDSILSPSNLLKCHLASKKPTTKKCTHQISLSPIQIKSPIASILLYFTFLGVSVEVFQETSLWASQLKCFTVGVVWQDSTMISNHDMTPRCNAPA